MLSFFKGVGKRWGEVKKKVVLHTNRLLLLGPGGLSEEDVQVHMCVNLRGGVRSPSGLPIPLPPRLRVRSPDSRNKGDTCRTSMERVMGMLSKSLSPPPATHPLLAHPSPLIKGALLDLLSMSSVVVELGSSSESSSIFSCAMSTSRKKPLLGSKFSRFSGSHSHKDKSPG